MATVVVEMNWPEPLTMEQLTSTDNDLVRCVGERGGTWLRSYVSPDRTRTVCVFEAPDAQSIRDAYRQAGVQGATIWPADLVESANAPVT